MIYLNKIQGFKNTFVLTTTGFKRTNLLIEDGRIKLSDNINDQELIELSDDLFVIPGIIDQHIHGASGSDVIDGTVEDLHKISCALASEGITAYLATTTTQSIDITRKSLHAVKEYINKNYEDGAEIIGVHLEGPFISKEFSGAQLANHILKPTVENYKKLVDGYEDLIKVITLAPENDENYDLIKYLKSKNIVVSIGHTNSNYDEVKIAVEYGASCVTHTYNAMKPLKHRELGTVGSALLFDQLYTEIICDGVHVSIPAINLLYKNKPNDKIILITDALRMKNMPEGKYEEDEQTIYLKGDEARLSNGILAGSVLKLNKAIKNVTEYTNCDLEKAIKFATENPAKNIGLFNVMGSIEENKLANLVVVDKKMNIYLTIRRGKVIYINSNLLKL